MGGSTKETMRVDLTFEDQLILLLARGNLTPHVQERAYALLATPLRWELILERAITHEVYPLIYHNLRKLDFPGVPAQVRTELEALSKINAFRNIHLAEELARVLTLLGGAGIPTIPLKGVTLAKSLYGDPTLRVCADLDILVPRQAVPHALSLLLADGYKAEFAERFFADLLLRGYSIEYALMRAERGIGYLLELHWGLLWGMRLDKAALEYLWAESHPQAFFGVGAYALSAEWELLFLAAHAARHCWQGLKWLVDLDEVCTRGGIDWGKVREKAKCLGWEEVLRLTFSACRTLFSTPIPEEFSLADLPSWLKLFPAYPSPDPWQSAFLRLRLLKRPSDKLSFLIHMLLVPTLADRRLCLLPPPLRFLYYPLRPLRLGCKWGWWVVCAGFQRLLSMV